MDVPAPDRPPRQAVLFDVDDTLYEVSTLVRQAWLHCPAVIAGLGLDLPALLAAYDRHRAGLTIPAALERVAGDLGADPSTVGTLHQVAQAYTPQQLVPALGAVELLADLRASGVLTGVVTNGDPRRQRAKLVALGLADAFDVVVVCDGAAVAFKPSPDPFRLALKAVGVLAEHAVMVGDRPDLDIAPAAAMGMGTVRLRVGNHAGLPGASGTREFTDAPLAWAHVRALVGMPAGALMPAQAVPNAGGPNSADPDPTRPLAATA